MRWTTSTDDHNMSEYRNTPKPHFGHLFTFLHIRVFRDSDTVSEYVHPSIKEVGGTTDAKKTRAHSGSRLIIWPSASPENCKGVHIGLAWLVSVPAYCVSLTRFQSSNGKIVLGGTLADIRLASPDRTGPYSDILRTRTSCPPTSITTSTVLLT